MPTYCPIYGDIASLAVSNAQNHFFDLGAQTYNNAANALNSLMSIDVLTPLPAPVSFNFDGVLQPFQRPLRPALDTSGMEFHAPAEVADLPDIGTGSSLSLDPQPSIDVTAPVLSFPNKPATPDILEPLAPSVNFNLLMPAEPSEPLPLLPTFEELNLPTVPNIVFSQMTSSLPTFTDPGIDDDWGFEPEAYVPFMKAQLVATLTPMLQSKPALPPHIEEAIFQKGRNRIEVETNRAIEQVFTQYAGRGFDVPNGLLNGSVLDTMQKGQDQIAAFNIEAVVTQYKETLENLRLAIVQGAALEATYINLHIEEQRLALEAARNQREGAVAVLNYRISVFQTRMDGYKAESQVVETMIRAELGKVELFRAQIEGEKARGEINESRVRLYSEQIKALGILYDRYRTQMEAVKIQADIEKTKVDVFKSQVDAFDSRWRAHASEWQGYSAGVEGEGRRVDIFKALLDGGMKRVDAWGMAQNVKIEAEKLEFARSGLKADLWKTSLQGYLAKVQAESTRIGAQSNIVDAQAKIYGADAQIEIAASASADRTLQVGLQAASASVDVQLKNAEMLMKRAENTIDDLISIRSTVSQVAAQLAASTMSAVNYSASTSSSLSTSQGCSTSFSFSGEVADA